MIARGTHGLITSTEDDHDRGWWDQFVRIPTLFLHRLNFHQFVEVWRFSRKNLKHSSILFIKHIFTHLLLPLLSFAARAVAPTPVPEILDWVSDILLASGHDTGPGGPSL